MRIRARASTRSTCPLCRALVLRSEGVECSTCGSISHRACVKELGGCHGTTLEDSGDFDWDQAEAETLAEERRQAQRRRRIEAQRQRRRAETPRPGGLSDSAENWVLGGAGALLLGGALLVGLRAGFEQGAAFAFCGAIGSFGLWRSVMALLTGEVETMEEGSSEMIDVREQPIRFVVNFLAWTAVGALMAWLAVDQLLGTG